VVLVDGEVVEILERAPDPATPPPMPIAGSDNLALMHYLPYGAGAAALVALLVSAGVFVHRRRKHKRRVAVAREMAVDKGIANARADDPKWQAWEDRKDGDSDSASEASENKTVDSLKGQKPPSASPSARPSPKNALPSPKAANSAWKREQMDLAQFMSDPVGFLGSQNVGAALPPPPPGPKAGPSPPLPRRSPRCAPPLPRTSSPPSRLSSSSPPSRLPSTTAGARTSDCSPCAFRAVPRLSARACPRLRPLPPPASAPRVPSPASAPAVTPRSRRAPARAAASAPRTSRSPRAATASAPRTSRSAPTASAPARPASC